MNKKGFTLIELIAVIIIVGTVAVFSLPALGNIISDNDRRACKYYEKAMVEAAKIFVQKEKKDMIEANGGTIPNSFIIPLDVLVSSGYLEEYSDLRTTIDNNNDTGVRITYDSSNNTYSYQPLLKCKKKTAGNTIHYVN